MVIKGGKVSIGRYSLGSQCHEKQKRCCYLWFVNCILSRCGVKHREINSSILCLASYWCLAESRLVCCCLSVFDTSDCFWIRFRCTRHLLASSNFRHSTLNDDTAYMLSVWVQHRPPFGILVYSPAVTRAFRSSDVPILGYSPRMYCNVSCDYQPVLIQSRRSCGHHDSGLELGKIDLLHPVYAVDEFVNQITKAPSDEGLEPTLQLVSCSTVFPNGPLSRLRNRS